MKVQNFIFNWKGHTNDALRLEKDLSFYGKTIVINSDVDFNYGQWVNLDDVYFAGQWDALLSRVDDDTDYIFHIQADASCRDFEKLFFRLNLFSNLENIGVYAPDVDYTFYKYDTHDLNEIRPGLYEVPVTDSTCWMINTCLLDGRMFFGPAYKYGWGVDLYYAALAGIKGLKVVRDYYVKVDHPKSTGYDSGAAHEEFSRWLFLQDGKIFRKITEKLAYQYLL